jgi:hypothetical protein
MPQISGDQYSWQVAFIISALLSSHSRPIPIDRLSLHRQFQSSSRKTETILKRKTPQKTKINNTENL